MWAGAIAFFKTPLGKGVGGAILVGLLIWGVLAWLNSYGDRRYREGVTATDQKWEEASQRVQEQARQSATKADDAAANRLAEYVEQSATEQEQVNDAIENGSSPFDVLFGGGS